MEKNQCLFEKYFVHSLNESTTTASAGIGGTATELQSSDFWNPGDARLPFSIFGKVITRNGAVPKKKRRKKRKRRVKTKKS